MSERLGISGNERTSQYRDGRKDWVIRQAISRQCEARIADKRAPVQEDPGKLIGTTDDRTSQVSTRRISKKSCVFEPVF
jgi:hypothetical protein